MCGLERDLAYSHLMPAALYDYLRDGGLSPIKVGRGFVAASDRQTQAYVLCESCEGVLSKGGETWVNPKFATMDRKFPLYDLVVQGPADYHDSDGAAYRVQLNPLIDADKLTHFAAGLFWKASVHPWLKDRLEPRIELGPYSDQLRRFLLGEAAFPSNMVLNIFISGPANAQIVMNDPHGGDRVDGVRTYFSHILGTLFLLSVGKSLPIEMRQLCFVTHPGHPLVISNDMTKQFEKIFATSFQRSRKTASFLKTTAKRGEQLRS